MENSQSFKLYEAIFDQTQNDLRELTKLLPTYYFPETLHKLTVPKIEKENLLIVQLVECPKERASFHRSQDFFVLYFTLLI